MSFESDGYLVVEDVVTNSRCDALTRTLPPVDASGSRTLLSVGTFQDLAEEIRDLSSLRKVVGKLVAVQCTLFRKLKNRNWAVRLHRDSVVPVKGDGPWKPCGKKEGLNTARPPREFLDECVAVRISLDAAVPEDISVVPGSHLDTNEYTRTQAVQIPVSRGGALVMRPTLAHTSSRLQHSDFRRVLHYLYASPDLPPGYNWYHAI